MLKQDITSNKQVNKLLELQPKLDIKKNQEYKVEEIKKSTVHTNKVVKSQLLGLYYSISWKGYSQAKDTWEAAIAVIHLQKMINTFHKDYPKKPIAILLSIDSATLMAKLISILKQKRGRFAKDSVKHAKKYNSNKEIVASLNTLYPRWIPCCKLKYNIFISDFNLSLCFQYYQII